MFRTRYNDFEFTVEARQKKKPTPWEQRKSFLSKNKKTIAAATVLLLLLYLSGALQIATGFAVAVPRSAFWTLFAWFVQAPLLHLYRHGPHYKIPVYVGEKRARTHTKCALYA
jgi:hypothetical protein